MPRVRQAVAFAFLLCIAVLLISCQGSKPAPVASEQPKAEPVEVKQPAPYTAKACLTRMADMAARWQMDAVPVRLESQVNDETTGSDGKSTIWKGTFASASGRAWKTFTCSGSRLKDAPPFGVTGDREMPLSPNDVIHGFSPLYVQVDSDKAFSIAQEHGGASLFKKDPKQSVYYFLALDTNGKTIAWYVSYGTSLKETQGIGIIDASTGKYLRAAK
ncbi:MAG: hypothetical protein ROO76_12610 [Terriglobia bacterium]|nr:hypothetical protein [Terriglobia bacterium]